MASVNKVILIGHLGADPEIRSFPNGGRIGNFRMATSESWTDKSSGEKRERTEWHSIVVQPDGLVGVAEKYLRKGSKAYVEGELRTRKWQDRDGHDRYTADVVIGFRGALVLLDRRSNRPPPADQDSYASRPAGEYARTAAPPTDDLDDDVPF